MSTQERQIEKINAIASMVGTEQFYLEVGKTLLTRSAEFGLVPDGMVAPSVKTEAGETLYIRPMPPYQNNCGFFGLLNHTGTATPRKDAVALLMGQAANPEIRALVAPELVEGLLERKDVMTLPGGEALSDHFVEAQDEVDRAVRMANTLMAAGGMTARDLLALDPESTDARLDGVRDAVVVQEQVLEAIGDWAQSRDTYTAFVNTLIGKPGRMLTYSRDSRFGASPTGVMDAIAKLSGRNLVIYQVEGAFIKPVHAYTSDTVAPTIALIHTAMGGDELNHFDLLEGTVSSIHAQEIIDEKLQEVDIDDSFTANMFFGTAMTLAGQIGELREAMQGRMLEDLVEEGVPLDEAAGVVEQFDNLDADIEAALAPELAPTKAAPVIEDAQVKLWAEAFVAAVNVDEGCELSAAEEAQRGVALAKRMHTRHRQFMQGGLTDRQAWIQVHAEITQTMSAINQPASQAQPDLIQVSYGTVLRGMAKVSKLALVGLKKLIIRIKPPKAAMKVAEEATEEVAEQVGKKAAKTVEEQLKKVQGRSGKTQRLKELAKDEKLGSADRGWIKQELTEVSRGKKGHLRNPPDKELAHKRGYEAAKGYDYRYSQLQSRDLHKLQHKYDAGGTLNKTPQGSLAGSKEVVK